MQRRPAAILLAAAVSFVAGAGPALAGGHLGEARDVTVDVQYSLYSYINQDGPVYSIGTAILYQVNLQDIGKRDFTNYQSKGLFVWAADYSCMWYGQTYSYIAGQPLPGTPDSGWQPINMTKGGGTASFSATYPIPLTVCPGSQASLILSMRRANSGNDDAGAFTIPAAVKFNK